MTRTLLAAVSIVLALLLAACGTSAGESSAAGRATDELRLGLTEWSVETGGVRLLPGEVRVTVTNAGGTRHDVVIHGEEGSWASPVLDPGESHDMVITTVPGEKLHLVCTLTGHESQGMHTGIDVVEDG